MHVCMCTHPYRAENSYFKSINFHGLVLSCTRAGTALRWSPSPPRSCTRPASPGQRLAPFFPVLVTVPAPGLVLSLEVSRLQGCSERGRDPTPLPRRVQLPPRPPRPSAACGARRAPGFVHFGRAGARELGDRSREEPRGPRAGTAGRRRSAPEWIPPCPRGLQTWTPRRSGRRCRCCCCGCCCCQVRAGSGRVRRPGGRRAAAGGSPVRGCSPGLGFPLGFGHQPHRSPGAHPPWISAWSHGSDSARAHPSPYLAEPLGRSFVPKPLS